jgi:hypothetical protein
MATLVTPSRTLVYTPGAQFRSAVSEELIQRLAGMENFISLFQHSEKQYFLNGDYSKVSLPQTAADGLAVFEFDATIIDVWMFNIVAGSTGTTELDVKISTTSGGAFTSIFSTTPKITSAAGNNAWVGNPSVWTTGSPVQDGTYTVPTGCTRPVLTGGGQTLDVNKYSAIRLDLISAQTGGQNCGLLIHYRPR